MASFQCSRHTDANGIREVFRKSRDMQRRSGGKYTFVVVLDEIGLAEASVNMPLKVSTSANTVTRKFCAGFCKLEG